MLNDKYLVDWDGMSRIIVEKINGTDMTLRRIHLADDTPYAGDMHDGIHSWIELPVSEFADMVISKL